MSEFIFNFDCVFAQKELFRNLLFISHLNLIFIIDKHEESNILLNNSILKCCFAVEDGRVWQLALEPKRVNHSFRLAKFYIVCSVVVNASGFIEFEEIFPILQIIVSTLNQGVQASLNAQCYQTYERNQEVESCTASYEIDSYWITCYCNEPWN